MSELPYTVVPAKLKLFLEKMPETGIPTKLNNQELVARGFKSSNDRSILGVLKSLGFIDESGVPGPNWVSFRDRGKNRALLAVLIQETYSSLYEVYPKAHTQADSDLKNLMATKTRSGERVVQAMLATFRTLVSCADFGKAAIDVSNEAGPDAHIHRVESGHRVAREDLELVSSSDQIVLELKNPRVRLIVDAPLTSKEADRIKNWFESVAVPWLGFHVDEVDQ